MRRIAIFLALTCLLCVECKNESNSNKNGDQSQSSPAVVIPRFNQDSAFSYVNQQVSFGPRAPGTESHTTCRAWITDKLDSWGWISQQQEFSASLPSGESVTGYNIVGSYRREVPRRIVLAAHWDSRRIADQDPDPEKRNTPIDGADDGASGVGVLLEIARILSENPLDLGVDIVFFDLEDQGSSSDDDSWCLGAQHWARNPHVSGYSAKFGVLLDMVGSKNIQYRKERATVTGQYSTSVAQKVENLYEQVWRLAKNMGYGGYFTDTYVSGLIIDDHYYVNRIAGIPMIDMINRPTPGNFGSHWHTHEDNINIIDRRSLRITGQVVLAVLYREAGGLFQ